MWSKSIFVSLALLAFQCTVSDAERCPDGFTYRKDTMSCHKDGDSISPWVDAAPNDASSPDSIQGIGAPCTTGKDCETFSADYCAVNPMAGAGFCTINDCEPGDCPATYTCCDCRQSSLVDQEEACIMDQYTEQLQALAGCTC